MGNCSTANCVKLTKGFEQMKAGGLTNDVTLHCLARHGEGYVGNDGYATSDDLELIIKFPREFKVAADAVVKVTKNRKGTNEYRDKDFNLEMNSFNAEMEFEGKEGLLWPAVQWKNPLCDVLNPCEKNAYVTIWDQLGVLGTKRVKKNMWPAESCEWKGLNEIKVD